MTKCFCSRSKVGQIQYGAFFTILKGSSQREKEGADALVSCAAGNICGKLCSAVFDENSPSFLSSSVCHY